MHLIVSLLAFRLQFVIKLELSWVENSNLFGLMLTVAARCQEWCTSNRLRES